MEQVILGDGLEGPDTVAFGLSAAPLCVLVGCCATAAALLRSALPAPLVVPGAGLLGATGITLAWGRWRARPALDWLVLAAAFILRTRLLPVLGRRAPDAPRPAGILVPLRHPEPPHRSVQPGRVLALVSLRGGTGRTAIACQLATAFARGRPGRVALVDLAWRSPSVAQRLGLVSPAGEAGAVVRPQPAGDVNGVAVLCPPGWPPLPGAARAAVAPLLAELAGGHELVVVDTDAGLDGTTAEVLEHCDTILMVSDGTPAGLLDTYRTARALRAAGHRRLRWLLNGHASDGDVSEVLGDLGAQLVARLPEEAMLDAGRSLHATAWAAAVAVLGDQLRRGWAEGGEGPAPAGREPTGRDPAALAVR